MDVAPSLTSDRNTNKRETAHAKLVVKIRKFLRMQRELGIVFPDDLHDPEPEEAPGSFPLHLPSGLSSQERSQLCPAVLVAIEDSLREAAARQALAELLQKLRVQTSTINFCATNVTGVHNNTKSLTLMHLLQEGIETDANVYCLHWHALVALCGGPGEWCNNGLCELRPTDVCGMNTNELSATQLANAHAARMRGLTVVEENACGDVSAGHTPEYDIQVQQLRGAVSHNSKGWEVSWIWQGTNLADGSLDPAGE
jgi:hypothetical protein